MNKHLATVSRRRFLAGAGAALLAPWTASRAAGEIAGGKNITLVVSYPAGGGADLMARLVAPRLAEALGQSVVVENKPGASGQLAAGQVARADPDGSVLLFDASSFAVNPALYPKLPYDSNKAFTPIAVLALFPNVLVCTPSYSAQNVRDVVQAAKAKPGAVAYASSGNGSAQHLAGALFEERAGVDMLHVPYKGGGPALNDVIGGQVPLFFANLASSFGHIQAGKLRPLAVTSKKRASAIPNVPTMEEAGIPGYEVYEWNPVLAPAGIGAETKAKLAAAFRKALAAPQVVERIASLSGEVFSGGPDEAAAFIRAQQAQWARVVKERKIAVE